MLGYHLNSSPLSILLRVHDDMARACQPQRPAVSLAEDPDRYTLTADLPGLQGKDIELSATHDSLTVRGKRELPSPEGYKIHRQERGSLEFSRVFRLPSTISVDAISAELKHGVLHVTIPKSKESQPRAIPIRSV